MIKSDWQQVITELAPSFLILVIVISLLLIVRIRIGKRNTKTLEELKEQNPTQQEKLIKFNAYLKLSIWAGFGLFWVGGSIYNYLSFPEQTKLLPLFVFLIGVSLVGFGIWSYFQEMKKLQK